MPLAYNPFMIKIATARTVIRNFSPDDWHDLQRIITDKEASEYAIYDYPFPTSELEVREIAAWFSKNDNYLAVWETTIKNVIGYVALNGDSRVYDLGYCLHSEYQNKGYAAETCTAVIDYAFKVLKAERLTGGTAVLNLPSCKLLAKLGFQKTGESITSFRKTAEGKDIEFTGASFELTNDVWLKTGKA